MTWNQWMYNCSLNSAKFKLLYMCHHPSDVTRNNSVFNTADTHGHSSKNMNYKYYPLSISAQVIAGFEWNIRDDEN